MTRLSFLKGGFVMFTCALLPACQDLTAKLPAGAVDPASYTTPEAAGQMAKNARYEFQLALLEFMLDAGGIADEFFDADSAARVIGVFSDQIVVLNQRHLPDETQQGTSVGGAINAIRSYKVLQRVRGISSLARQSVQRYAPGLPNALQGELFVYEAFSEVMLADLYCSGIPLSIIESAGDYVYRPGTNTLGVYEHAVVLFDSAIALSQGDPAILSLARVGKGRALLAIGRYAAAATVVRDVPTGFRFELPILRIERRTASAPTGYYWTLDDRIRKTVADRKGGTGMPFVGARDPRVLLISPSTNSPLRIPATQTHLLVANSIEARLIEAESKAQVGDTAYLGVLNTLRTDGTYTVNASGDTIYNAGTGGVAGLRPLRDPGLSSSDARQALDTRADMIMEERAYWLFFTGHRQGDLRRLLRHYQRDIEEVYPTGPVRGGIGYYDSYVDVPIPADERYNPRFTGCIGRGE